MILDTCFLIDVMRNEKDAIRKLNSLAEKNEVLLITSVSIFELFSGLPRSQNQSREKEKIKNVIEGQLILYLDKKSAEIGGIVDGELITKGEMIEPFDSMIAGIALNKNQKVLTRNVKDFSKIKGLVIDNY